MIPWKFLSILHLCNFFGGNSGRGAPDERKRAIEIKTECRIEKREDGREGTRL